MCYMGVNFCNKIGIDQSEFEVESSIINSIANEVLNPISFLSNKDIINVLLRKISSECDLVRKDIYRCALELVVEKTPDDL
ncbi:hypothetical protein CNZ44_004415 [Shigella flexneri]|nr:hypothetical protein [Shigella flexneri]